MILCFTDDSYRLCSTITYCQHQCSSTIPVGDYLYQSVNLPKNTDSPRLYNYTISINSLFYTIITSNKYSRFTQIIILMTFISTHANNNPAILILKWWIFIININNSFSDSLVMFSRWNILNKEPSDWLICKHKSTNQKLCNNYQTAIIIYNQSDPQNYNNILVL